MTRVDALTVVIPARNEVLALPACLEALHASFQLAGPHADVILRAIVVLDSCTDGSDTVVRAATQAWHQAGRAALESITVMAGGVGLARAIGNVRALALHAGAGHEPDTLWLASTDADTLVPGHWISTHLCAARAGEDALVGTVEPDATLPLHDRALWLERHHLVEDHPHVHGANLGVRASAYLAVGGYRALTLHEDADLVGRLRAAPGVRVRATDAHRVVTSSRLEARASGGFATYLKNLTRGVS